MRKLPPLAELRAFEAAARCLSFKLAAAELGVTPTAVSHQIKLLEAYCGQSLFRRQPRPVALTWAGEPMAKARLGSIVPLQMCFTPGQIESCLDRWCTMLRGHAAARCAMSAVVREALFRDIIGFIPVYTGSFTFGLWFGYTQLEWSWLQILWWALPLTALVADYGEDLCHLRCLRLHQKGQCPSIPHALVGSVMTWVKLIGFFGEGALTLVIVAAATIKIYQAPVGYGWRGLVVLAISIVAGLILGGLTVGSIVYRKIIGKTRKHVHVSADSRGVPLTESTGV